MVSTYFLTVSLPLFLFLSPIFFFFLTFFFFFFFLLFSPLYLNIRSAVASFYIYFLVFFFSSFLFFDSAIVLYLYFYTLYSVHKALLLSLNYRSAFSFLLFVLLAKALIFSPILSSPVIRDNCLQSLVALVLCSGPRPLEPWKKIIQPAHKTSSAQP